jgi:hypothetical protein
VGEYLFEDDIPTFGPISDFFVVLCTAKDLDFRASKGETLKEMAMIKKAGLNHPGESTVVCALKHPIPGFLGKGSATNRTTTALLAIKTAADWDVVFTKEMARGLKNLWKENQANVEAVIHGHIEDSSLGRHGHQALVAALARKMLSTLVKFTNELFDYLTNTYHNLTDRIGFLPNDAWLLSTEIVARICKALNSSRSEVHTISAKSSSIQTTAKILYGMLMVHDVMAEYLKFEVKNHLSVSLEYVKLLAAHGSFIRRFKLSRRGSTWWKIRMWGRGNQKRKVGGGQLGLPGLGQHVSPRANRDTQPPGNLEDATHRQNTRFILLTQVQCRHQADRSSSPI